MISQSELMYVLGLSSRDRRILLFTDQIYLKLKRDDPTLIYTFKSAGVIKMENYNV